MKNNQEQNKVLSNVGRLKDLAFVNKVTGIFREGIPVNEALQQICIILPDAMQYPGYTEARIRYGNKCFNSPHFKETQWKLQTSFQTIEKDHGSIEVYYTEQFAEFDEGPFLKEERILISNMAEIIKTQLNTFIGRKSKTFSASTSGQKILEQCDGNISMISKQMLRRLMNKHNANRDIFHDLMPYKVREILLVATLYDAYTIEKEGRFTEKILGEYHQLNLTSMPRVTAVSSTQEAMEQLRSKHFDLVIIMLGVDKTLPPELSKTIKKEFNYIQIFLLLNNNSEISYIKKNSKLLKSIDKTFIWNGDSKVFFAMVKSIEDWVNVDNDTEVGMVGLILLVEDSPIYYSRYLPMLYSIIMDQTRRLIEEVNADDLYKVHRVRARPKILLASNYEEAWYIYSKYKDYLLCLITDMKYEKDGVMVENAGEILIENIRSNVSDMPAVIQSSDVGNKKIADRLGVRFIDKNSGSLIREVRNFLRFHLGFGDFYYKINPETTIGTAKTLAEFEEKLLTIPDKSLLYHAKRNHFSQWLMARGEIHIGGIIHPVGISDFKDCDDLRSFLVNIIKTFRHEQKDGKVVSFDETALLNESNIVSLATGALGGKGRGLAFINTLIYNIDFPALVPGINIRAPRTSIIGTDEFEEFMEKNDLYAKAYDSDDYVKIRKWFVDCELSDGLKDRLRKLLEVMNKPLAVRSSGLFEDSLTMPFAGIFETYKLPNNNPDIEIRLWQLMTAVKLVYASVFSNTAKRYVEAINHKIEEEKMAVIVQEVVGNMYGDMYYPHISGVGQSYNYYPYAHMKPEEGFVVAAVGLGKYVADGEKAHRFSPIYPDNNINSPEDQVKDSQVVFWAVDLAKKNINLLDGEDAALIKVDIGTAEKHGTLKHCASVFDYENNRIVAGLTAKGPRVVNFANILKYNYIPLAKTLEIILELVREAMGTPVELEFAVDLNKDKNGRASFYLLQIKPLIGNAKDYEIKKEDFTNSDILLYSEKCMGNGFVDYIQDVIYVDNDKFDKTETIQMVKEIETLNIRMKEMDRKYMLIGPGRWGTRDRFIGIPVTWPQISNAKIIVETSLKDFPLDASLGSHFFHHVTAMDVGYFSVQPELSENFINYNVLSLQKTVSETKYLKHVVFDKPLKIRMDGKKRISLVTFEKDAI